MTELTKEQMAICATAGFAASQMLRAGFTASQMLDAGFTASQMLRAGFTASQMLDGVPLIENPYTTLLAAINADERKFQQSTFGPENTPATPEHICETAMCTAGHLVSMAGKEGWALRKRLGFSEAAALIHAKAHPDYPCQNFGCIPDAWGLAYIEMMAGIESVAGKT